MSEQNAEATATEPKAASTENEAATEPKPTETVDFWKAKAREQEKRAKENADAAKRLGEIEESQKSEAQKVADRLAQAESDAGTAASRADRAEIALSKGLTLSQAKRLVGTTREELEADADELLKDIGVQTSRGNRAPGEGKTSKPKADEDRREFVRQLTGKD